MYRNFSKAGPIPFWIISCEIHCEILLAPSLLFFFFFFEFFLEKDTGMFWDVTPAAAYVPAS